MQRAVATLSFALTYAVGIEFGNRFAVYYLEFWDPKFHDQAGNVEVFHEALPILVALATLSFLAGLSNHREWLADARVVPVMLGGALSGTVASLLLLLDPALRTHEALKAVDGGLGMVLFWGGPACLGALGFSLVRSYASRGEV